MDNDATTVSWESLAAKVGEEGNRYGDTLRGKP
jgi:hypothetical protein